MEIKTVLLFLFKPFKVYCMCGIGLLMNTILINFILRKIPWTRYHHNSQFREGKMEGDLDK
jgi:hypothetical protein